MGCETLGPCDEPLARTVVYSDDADGLPAYAGQALIQQSCGGSDFCHAEGADDRYGAPAGLDFDVNLSDDAADTERLRRAQLALFRHRHDVWATIDHGTMPPGSVGKDVAALGRPYRDLPALDSAEGREIVRNWLACGVPVVERDDADRPAGVTPVGAEIASSPTVDTGACMTDVCANQCVDIESDPSHCGGCDIACASGEVCFFGACSADGCPSAFLDCSGACVDPTSSNTHCGDCNTVCPGDRSCLEGACECASPLVECSGACTDTTDDAANCGGCGMACASGELCEGSTCVTCGAGVSFATDIQPIFTATCAGSTCHEGRRPAADLSLEGGKAYASLVGIASDCGTTRLRVAPGQPDASYLIDKLRGRNLCRGQQMPLREAPLADADVRLIENWICAGAPDN